MIVRTPTRTGRNVEMLKAILNIFLAFVELSCAQDYKLGPNEVGFIGDGLNDTPALANANVGIGIQEVGSQALIDASSAVLQGELGQLPAAIVIARRTQKLVIANICLALSINLGVIIAAATVGLSLWVSVLLDNGSLTRQVNMRG